MEEKSEPKVLKQWHQIFGAFLARRFQPTDIQVDVEVSASILPPAFDILLLRREHLASWTEAQRAVLPDGIRDTQASRIVIEFKYTQSLDVNAVHQALIYDVLYRQSQKLRADQVSTFLICSKRPMEKQLKAFSFEPTPFAGLYQNSSPLANRVHLISLNDLSHESHNTAFKLFASRKAVRNEAFEQMNQNPQGMPDEALWFAQAMRIKWPSIGASMIPEITEEEIIEIGKVIGKNVLSRATVQERLEGITAEQRLEGLSTEKRLEGIPTEKRLEGIPTEKRLEGLSTEQRLKGVPVDEALMTLRKTDLGAFMRFLKQFSDAPEPS